MIDLHCHSHISDGTLSPTEVVKLAAQNGCKVLALTDHDNTAGLTEARETAQQHGIHFINGVEISVSWRGRTIHIVGLDFNPNNPTLQNLLQQLRQGRQNRVKQIAQKLTQYGISHAYEGSLALCSNPENISRTHIADFLVQQGHVRNKQQAFTKYLGDGKKAAVAHQWAELKQAIEAIYQANGIAVIAHPMRYSLSATARRQLFTEFSQLGGKAIEIHSGNASLNDRLTYAQFAQQYQFLASVGSDFHRPNDYSGGILGQSPQLPPNCHPIWSYFQTPINTL